MTVCVCVVIQLQLPSIIRHAKCQIIYLLYVQLTKADWTPHKHTLKHMVGGIYIQSPEWDFITTHLTVLVHSTLPKCHSWVACTERGQRGAGPGSYPRPTAHHSPNPPISPIPRSHIQRISGHASRTAPTPPTLFIVGTLFVEHS